MSAPAEAPFATELISSGQTASDLLPAVSRTADNRIEKPSVSSTALEFLERDLLVERLDKVKRHLWMAGRPMPPRHLGYQKVRSRDIIVSEEMELHLVWKTNCIYIKPLPQYLLALDLWQNCLAMVPAPNNRPDKRDAIAKTARGFLLSYCALVAYESDFHLAKELGLLPCELAWKDWKAWTAEVMDKCPYSAVNPRFWYGELRLGRLNKIYRWRKGSFIRGYSRIGAANTYGELLRDNFSVLAALLGYIVIVLTAMQVGLGTDHLQGSAAFQRASWGFTVFSIISPLAATVIIFALFLVMFVSNWVETKRFEKTRFRAMGVEKDEA